MLFGPAGDAEPYDVSGPGAPGPGAPADGPADGLGGGVDGVANRRFGSAADARVMSSTEVTSKEMPYRLLRARSNRLE